MFEGFDANFSSLSRQKPPLLSRWPFSEESQTRYPSLGWVLVVSPSSDALWFILILLL